jgi:hypothetical protein
MFTYPKPIQATKSYLQIIIFASILLTPVVLLNNRIEQYSSISDYMLSLLLPYSLLPLSCIFYIGAWPNIKVLDSGIEIEFLWRSLFIPFNEITGTIHTGSGKFGVTVVEVRAGYLTHFHRIYGVLSFKSIKPCFYIHSNIHNYNSLLKIVTPKTS